jgi:hypothetical protein
MDRKKIYPAGEPWGWARNTARLIRRYRKLLIGNIRTTAKALLFLLLVCQFILNPLGQSFPFRQQAAAWAESSPFSVVIIHTSPFIDERLQSTKKIIETLSESLAAQKNIRITNVVEELRDDGSTSAFNNFFTNPGEPERRAALTYAKAHQADVLLVLRTSWDETRTSKEFLITSVVFLTEKAKIRKMANTRIPASLEKLSPIIADFTAKILSNITGPEPAAEDDIMAMAQEEIKQEAPITEIPLEGDQTMALPGMIQEVPATEEKSTPSPTMDKNEATAQKSNSAKTPRSEREKPAALADVNTQITPLPITSPWYDHLTKKWWFWTTVGVVVTGAGIGVAAGMAGSGESANDGGMRVNFEY